jgi:dephospho-CoA kinase
MVIRLTMFINSNYLYTTMPKIFQVVGVCGRRRSGKDTVAGILDELYGYKNVKISSDLKNALKIIFGFDHEQIEGNLKDTVDENWGVSPRQAMQFIGTEVMQYKIAELLPDMGRKFWIKGFINKHIANGRLGERLLVITDIRFMHEYNELKRHLHNDLLMLRVERDLNGKEGVDEHSSEQEFLNIPVEHIISNNGSKEDLKTCVSNIFNAYQNKHAE